MLLLVHYYIKHYILVFSCHGDFNDLPTFYQQSFVSFLSLTYGYSLILVLSSVALVSNCPLVE
jgi:hypothetical protein